MEHIIACVDGSASAIAVCEAGAWVSQRVQAPLKLLHVLEPSIYTTETDLSGSIGLGSRELLLEQLVAVEEQRSRLAQEHGKQLLRDAADRAERLGAVSIQQQQRRGPFVETVREFQDRCRVLVVGRRGEQHASTVNAIGSHLETLIRTVQRPLLVALRGFQPPQRFSVAYDGSATGDKMLDKLCESPLLQGLPCDVLTVGQDTAERRQQLDLACARLTEAGYEVSAQLLSGEVQPAICARLQQTHSGLLVMGAYGHSRIREFFIGSNTTSMLVATNTPVLLLR